MFPNSFSLDKAIYIELSYLLLLNLEKVVSQELRVPVMS